MAFSDVLTGWSASNHPKVTAAHGLCNQFKSSAERVYHNLDCDPAVTDGEREAMLSHLLDSGASSWSDVAKCFIQFCRQHTATVGPLRPEAAGATLGHAFERRRLERTMTDSSAASPFVASVTATDFAVDEFLIRSLDQQRGLMASTPLSPSPRMWSFFQPTKPAAPFTGLRRTQAELRRRLGLGGIPVNGLMVHCSHRLPNPIVPLKATAFHAEMYEYFRPGGKTFPLGNADGDFNGGLDETIHATIMFAELVEPLRPAP
jgi:hypothetical protein